MGRYPVPSPEEQRALARRVVAGDAEARRQMIAANLRLVVHWAKRYRNSGIELADLVQEGVFGLAHAVDKYDPEKGFTFSTYATWWIRQALQRASARESTTIRVPAEATQIRRQVMDARDELRASLAREPTIEEIAAHTCINLEKVAATEHYAYVGLSIEHPLSEDGNEMSDILPDPNGTVEMDRLIVRADIAAALDTLEDDEATVIRLRYGLDGGEPLSYDDIAKKMHLSWRTISTIERVAMAKLACLIDAA